MFWSQILRMWLSELTNFLPVHDASKRAANKVTRFCVRAHQASMMVLKVMPLCWSQIFTMWLPEHTCVLPVYDASKRAADKMAAGCNGA